MKTIFALVALLVSTTAFSACYMIYAPSNELVWRGTAAPVRMDAPSLKDEINKMVPKGHMVVSSEIASCYALDLTTPRKTMRDKAEEIKHDRGRPTYE
ncbi:MAG: hypothetical protein QM739_07195 [Propionivibrio sp.]